MVGRGDKCCRTYILRPTNHLKYYKKWKQLTETHTSCKRDVVIFTVVFHPPSGRRCHWAGLGDIVAVRAGLDEVVAVRADLGNVVEPHGVENRLA